VVSRFRKNKGMKILVRGGGDVASGAILRMRRAGWKVLVTELEQPRAVRRAVSFGLAVYSREVQVEEVKGRLAASVSESEKAIADGYVAVMVDPEARCWEEFGPQVIVDGRMRKIPPEKFQWSGALVIGLGPGFSAPQTCDAVVETNRGPYLGRVYWQGTAQPDTGIPEQVGGFDGERVLRAPVGGVFTTNRKIGDAVQAGDLVAIVQEREVLAPFKGVLRGLLQGGMVVQEGEKIGDIDPRGDAQLCWLVSDKALAVGGGVLEAVLAAQAGLVRKI
jgi:xanthine dehydrogenase accessory factor